MVKHCACSWPRYVLLTSFSVLSFLHNFLKVAFLIFLSIILHQVLQTNVTARLFAAQCRLGQVSFSYTCKGRQLSWDTQTSAQVSHQIQALQHRLTSALLLPYWCGFSKRQSSQKTRIKEFNVEGNRHCIVPVLMEFCTEDYFVFRNWRCAEALKHEKNLSPWGQVDFYLRRQEVEQWCLWACLGSKVCLSLRAAVWNCLLHHGPMYSTVCSPTQFHSGWKWICPRNHG